MAFPSSSASSEDGMAAVPHALVEGVLEGLIRLHAPNGPPADAAGGRTDRGPPARRTRRRSDGRTGRSPEESATDGTARGLPGRRPRALHRELPALLLVARDELRPRAAVRVHGGRPLRLRNAAAQGEGEAEPETRELRHGALPSGRICRGPTP